MKKASKTPILDSLKKYIAENNLRLHMPGHKGETILPEDNPIISDLYEMDLTEIPGLDDLHNPVEAIAQSEQLTADLFGANASYFLINGATAGIQAAFLSTVAPGRKVLVPRNAHKSVLNSLILTGADPVYVPVELHRDYGFTLGVKQNAIKHEEYDAIFNVRPTYEGIIEPLIKIENNPHKEPIQIVDEAHGSHLKFSNSFPKSALKIGGDYIIHGTHKTLGSLTQTGLLHLSDRGDKAKTRQSLALVQSTSPSYILLASLEIMRYNMESKAKELLTNCLYISDYIRKNINQINGFHCVYPEEVHPRELDPSKIVIIADNLNGYELAKVLRTDYRIQVEMATDKYILGMITINDSMERGKKLVKAIKDISERFRGKNKGLITINQVPLPNIPPQVMLPRVATFANNRRIKLAEARGQIAAETFCPYPPGIPIICPGELVTEDIIEYIKYIKALGRHWQGFSDFDLNTILVVE